ncbi:MAG: hypothetical protein ACK4FF_08115 [Limnobacter sp.]|uniref:hypothetical protein n=1 Tax=Limnobacter sp. TaxID=2003368 RepID=UPI00391A71A5
MTKKEIKAKVLELLSAGVPKSTVFKQLTGQGVKDDQLAYYIASYVNPQRSEQQERKVNILVTILLIQTLGAVVLTYAVTSAFGTGARWVAVLTVLLIQGLMIFGFYHHKLAAYNMYSLLCFVSAPRWFNDLSTVSASSIGAMILNFALIGFVLYLRHKLFPDVFLFGPVRRKGEHWFVD